jgi:hypothetical protein
MSLDLSSTSQSPSAQVLQTAIYLKMTPAQKWEQVCKLRAIAWALKKAGLKVMHPDWSELELDNEVRKVFLYAVT